MKAGLAHIELTGQSAPVASGYKAGMGLEAIGTNDILTPAGTQFANAWPAPSGDAAKAGEQGGAVSVCSGEDGHTINIEKTNAHVRDQRTRFS